MLIIYPMAITLNKYNKLTKTEMKNAYLRGTPGLWIFTEALETLTVEIRPIYVRI